MNAIQHLVWPYNIDHLPTNIRGSFRLGLNGNWSTQIDWPSWPANASPVLDGSLYALLGVNNVIVTNFNDHVQIEFVNDLANQQVAPLTVDGSPEQSFDSGETWEAMFLSIVMIQEGNQ